ncbi:TM2 domain-containing protein [Streptomyces sp. NPDC048639]|uniref:TM2 domain-containing protein n=1 Tax=Streptomyces sp. NPDC048639 TaxID=3365581 RepID=UPI00371D277D
MSYPAQPPSAEAPYGVAPNGQPYSEKSKIVAGLLQLFLGGLGIGRFYTGYTGMAIAQLLTCGGLGVWSLIDAIIFFVSETRTDKQGRLLRS